MKGSWEKEYVAAAISSSINYSQVLRKLGHHVGTSNFKILKRKINEYGLSISHFTFKPAKPAKRRPSLTNKDVFKKDSPRSSKTIKRAAFRSGFLSDECAKCGIGSEWQGESLTLHLDHINGDNSDNRVENLRILCPNCHSQTNTFAGRNKKSKPPKVTNECLDCGIEIYHDAKRCLSCHNKSQEKVDWPSVEKLITMVAETNYSAVGRKLGVSDNAVRKRIRKHGGRTIAG